MAKSGLPKGRPPKLNAQVIEDVRRLQSIGATNQICQDYINVSETTWYNWVNKGEADPGSIYGAFVEAVKEGRSRSAIINLEAVQAAARKGSWQASCWVLERRHNYKNLPPAIEQVQANPIDVSTEEGAERAAEILNSLPVSVLARIDHRRLVAAANLKDEDLTDED